MISQNKELTFVWTSIQGTHRMYGHQDLHYRQPNGFQISQCQNSYCCILWVQQQLSEPPQGKRTFVPLPQVKPQPPQCTWQSLRQPFGHSRLEKPCVKLPGPKWNMLVPPPAQAWAFPPRAQFRLPPPKYTNCWLALLEHSPAPCSGLRPSTSAPYSCSATDMLYGTFTTLLASVRAFIGSSLAKMQGIGRECSMGLFILILTIVFLNCIKKNSGEKANLIIPLWMELALQIPCNLTPHNWSS